SSWPPGWRESRQDRRTRRRALPPCRGRAATRESFQSRHLVSAHRRSRRGTRRQCTLVTMRPERTEAIILHTFPARERDKLVVFLTPDHGKKKGWAYGARSLRSRFGAALEPLAKVRIGFVE